MSITQERVEEMALWYEPIESSNEMQDWDEYVDEYLRSTPEEDQSEEDCESYLDAFENH